MPEKTRDSDVYFTQNLLCPIVTLGQCFLLFPVYGFRRRNDTRVWFKWLSLKTILSILFAFYSGLICAVTVYKFIYHKKKVLAIYSLLYHLTVGLLTVCFIHVAKKWPKLMKEWSFVDSKMRNFEKNPNLRCRIRMVVTMFMVLAIGEHLFFMASLKSIQEITWENFGKQLDAYFIRFYGGIFKIIRYNRFVGVFVQIMNWLFTLAWNYGDIYLTVMCIPLNFRLNQIKRKLILMIKYKIRDPVHWRQLRETFVHVSNICVSTEKCTGHLLVLSMGFKIITILYQMLGALKGRDENVDDGKLEDRLYFIFSVGIMILKLIFVTIYYSSVDLLCQDIVGHLFNVPSHIYNIEIERFIVFIKQSQPVLSGLKLYKMRRSLILKMASVVVVYELVLITFSN